MFKKISPIILMLLCTLQTQSLDNQVAESLPTDAQDNQDTLRSKKCEHFCCIDVSGNQHIRGNLTVGGDITVDGNVNLGSTNAGDLVINGQSIGALFDIGFFSFNLAPETTRAVSPVTINPGDSLPFPDVDISSAVTAISETQFSLPVAGTYKVSAAISLATTDENPPVDPIQFAVRIDGNVVDFTITENATEAEAQLVINDVLIDVLNPSATLDVINTGDVAFNFTQGALFIQRISNAIPVS